MVQYHMDGSLPILLSSGSVDHYRRRHTIL
jgi:hypothetical protein